MIKAEMPVKAILSKDNELIPIWREDVICENTDMYGIIVTIKGEYEHQSIVDCLYNLLTGSLERFETLDFYPKKLKFSKGDKVTYEHEKDRNCVSISKIKNIIYEDFEYHVYDYKTTVRMFPNLKRGEHSKYYIKHWNPWYVLENGMVIKWEHQLKRIKDD